jgi:ferritin-like metal-binding protein YciE
MGCFDDELRHLYSVENQLIKALPSFAKGANSDDLQTLFIKHLGETKRQVVRLRKSFGIIGAKPTGEHCKGMESIIDEGRDALEKDEDGASFDSGLIGAALKVEHYEIARYHTALNITKAMGLSDVTGEGNDFETKKDQEADRTSNDDERAGAATLKKEEA